MDGNDINQEDALSSFQNDSDIQVELVNQMLSEQRNSEEDALATAQSNTYPSDIEPALSEDSKTESMNVPFVNEYAFKQYILSNIRNDISICEDYQDNVIIPSMKARYDAYYAEEEYYKKKFKNLSKRSNIVDTSVADTVEWALPSLIRLFFGSETPITITGIGDNDVKAAKVMDQLISYQLMRKNNAFLVFYNWFKDALLGFGVIKCIWDRETAQVPKTIIVSYARYIELTNNPMIQITGAESADMFGNVAVSYLETVYKKNNPKVENILVSEFLFPPRLKNIEDATFVAHKKRVTLSYLNQRAKDGVYTNVDKLSGNPETDYDELELDINDNYDTGYTNNLDKARTEVIIYECYTKLDINGDGILEDLIVTVCENEILRIEINPFGRHPFFLLSPSKDPHRVYSKRAIPEMVGQLQDLKTALIRQMVINIGLTNDPRMILSEEAINIDDYINGKAIIRKKAGYSMADSVMAMPIQPLHPWTFQFLEYIEAQKEARTGVTRYNQGLDGSSLNKTASGINAIIGQSQQRLDLIARMFKETGISDLYRFLISLNQKFVDQPTVIRITDKELKITPDDLRGEIDLEVNASAGISAKQENMQYIQTLMTANLQLAGAGVQIATPDNFYNLMKRWITESGLKNPSDYITQPALVQQRAMMEIQMRQQVVQSLPFPIQQEYMQTGMLRPEVLMQLPVEIQMLLVGDTYGQNGNGQSSGQKVSGEFGGGSAGISGGLGTGVQGQDNRKPAPLFG